MIDAAGAIYVIGGSGWDDSGYDTSYQDVWMSTDGGARPGLRQGGNGGTGWTHRRLAGTTGVLLRGTRG